jgi:hypothetical protein
MSAGNVSLRCACGNARMVDAQHAAVVFGPAPDGAAYVLSDICPACAPGQGMFPWRWRAEDGTALPMVL